MITLKRIFQFRPDFLARQFVTVQMILATEQTRHPSLRRCKPGSGAMFRRRSKMKAQLRPVTVDRLYGPMPSLFAALRRETVVTNARTSFKVDSPHLKPSLKEPWKNNLRRFPPTPA